MNEYQENRFVRAMLRAMFNTVVGKRIALFGFAFKANTSDTRESPAIHVAKKLLEERATVVITDPQALASARLDLSGVSGDIEYTEDPYEAARGAHAIAVMTEWEQYRGLDYGRIFDSMEKPAFVFDGRNILDHTKLFDLGFSVYPIGSPALNRF